jgi:tol-pal system protein YbgF
MRIPVPTQKARQVTLPMLSHSIQSVQLKCKSRRASGFVLGAIVFLASFSAPAFAVNKDMVQLQTQIQQLQDAVARLQQSNDERMGVMKDLVQQSADAVNRMSTNIDTLQKHMLTQQETQNGKIDQVSGQIQSLNDSLDEIKARMARLEKLTQDIQNQQQSMSANMQNLPSSGGAAPAPMSTPDLAPVQPLPTQPAAAPITRKGKPSPSIPAASLMPSASLPTADAASASPPADELYKTALGDYMSAKYSLASSEFNDVIKNYPDNSLSGNAYYYHGEIEYRGGRYGTAIKDYDHVLEQFPDSNKVPVAHLHKGQALIALKQQDAGVREFRALIQRFPNSPEAMSARSKMNGMAIPITPRVR